MAPSVPYAFHVQLPRDGTIGLPKVTSASLIGITVAICGNVLISLALNFQKLAHRRLDREKASKARERDLETRRNAAATNGGAEENQSQTRTNGTTIDAVLESSPLLQHSHSDPSPRAYGTGSNSIGSSNAQAIPLLPQPVKPTKPNLISHLIPFPLRTKATLPDVREDTEEPGERYSAHAMLPVDDVYDSPVENGAAELQHGDAKIGNGKEMMVDHENESDYLKSKLWWLGFLLMNIGECGNFISYAFAPASVVAPLGTFALIANCVFAPLMLGERFRKLDLLGIFIAILGAITVVLAANTTDVRLDPKGLQRAISQRPFIIFVCIYAVAAIVLAGLSEGKFGRSVVFVDVGLCAIFGGFTVLATKAISTLLALEWWDMFTEWITYPVIVVLVLTGVGQIRYLNRALKRFDSKVIIPIQFVLFTLSAIIGSAILYGDFKETKFHQRITFLYGCAATFLGVFVIAWASAEDSSFPDYDCEQGVGEGEGGAEGGVDVDGERVLHVGGSGGVGGAGVAVRRRVPGSPIVRHQPSLIGLSPAQHLLLVHTPPRDRPDYWDREVEHSPTPNLSNRRRAVSWFGEERPARALIVRRGEETDEE